MKKHKLAILTSHPIQYQAPLFRKMAEIDSLNLTVYFFWDFGIKDNSYDSGFGQKVKWDIPLLSGYRYKFLKNYSLQPSSSFWGQINPGIIIELIKNNYDAIIIFGWNSLTNWLVFFTAFILRIPILWRGENPFNQELRKPSHKRFIKKLILGFLFRRAAAVLYIGEQNRKFYKYYGVPDKKLFFAPYAVDNTRFMEQAEKLKTAEKVAATKKELGIELTRLVILFVGKIVPLKRPFDLLRAYKKLRDRASLVFVGDGALRSDLERYADEKKLDQVKFVGFRNQSELPKYYSLADLLVLPSESETWGLVVNEAMCFGLPIIVSDVVGCGQDLVKNDENGYFFRLGNIAELTQCLEKIVSDSDKRRKFGEESLKIVTQYSYDEDIKTFLRAVDFAL